MPQTEIEHLAALIDEAYAGPAWHGPSLRGALRGVTPRQAARRPGPGRHNIWELAVHAAYWKYAVRRRILGEKTASFGEKGSNWFERRSDVTAVSLTAWRRDLDRLARAHAALRDTVLGLDPARLDRRAAGSRHSPRRMILGIAMHDVYHAGQIPLLKRLAGRG